MNAPVVEVAGLRKEFRPAGLWGGAGSRVVALDDVGFRLERGEFAALVGESGSGKTTLGRILLGLLPFDAGFVRVAGQDVGRMARGQRRMFRRRAQMVFQSPYASLNPALRVRSTLAEAVRVHQEDLDRAGVAAEVSRLAELVHLPPERLDEFPTSLSGGERRRVGFGRAMATRPEFVVTDEPVAGLDPPIQGQLLELLQRIHRRREITFLLISHDLRVVRTLATRVVVLFRGRVLENAPAREFFAGEARHPYSQNLLLSAFDAATCMRDRRGVVRQSGGVGGCPYRPRCPLADVDDDAPCATMPPPLRTAGADHWVACHKRGRV
jgi:ABC-type glutathione transport system ATPase component